MRERIVVAFHVLKLWRGQRRRPVGAAMSIVTRQAALICVIFALAAVGLSGRATPAGASAIYVADPDAGTGKSGALFSLDQAGNRSLVSDFGRIAAPGGGPHQPKGVNPLGAAVELDGHVLVVDNGTNGAKKAALFRVDPVSGTRKVLSDFEDPSQGPLGVVPSGVAVTATGIWVSDAGAGSTCAGASDPCGAVFRVDPISGARTIASDFGNLAQGSYYIAPDFLTAEAGGTLLTTAYNYEGFAGLVRVDPGTGMRSDVSNFNDPAQGATPQTPFPGAVAVEATGAILVFQAEQSAAQLGQIYRVEPVTGMRSLVSDFSNSAQGPGIQRSTGATSLTVASDAGGPFVLISGKGFRTNPVNDKKFTFPAVFKVDPTTGVRSLFSDFSSSAQGPLGMEPSGIAVLAPPAPPPPAPDQLFVANAYANSITVYDLTASGDTAPARSISGASTGLDFPVALALDTSAKQLFVANVPDPPALESITVYSLSASGDVARLRTLSGANTGLSVPGGIVVDRAHNELVVANAGNNSITVYDLTASGDAIPKRTLAGAMTGLALGDEVPVGLAIDLAHDELFVTNFAGARVSVFTRTAQGNTAPLRNLGGPATRIIGPTGLALDLTNDELFVVNPGNDTVLVFSRTATANTAPLRTLAGASTELAAPQNPALDGATAELFVPNAGDNSVTVYARTSSGDTAPLRTISGPTTGLAAPLAITIGH